MAWRQRNRRQQKQEVEKQIPNEVKESDDDDSDLYVGFPTSRPESGEQERHNNQQEEAYNEVVEHDHRSELEDHEVKEEEEIIELKKSQPQALDNVVGNRQDNMGGLVDSIAIATATALCNSNNSNSNSNNNRNVRIPNDEISSHNKKASEQDESDVEGDQSIMSNASNAPNILQDLAQCSWDLLGTHIHRLQLKPDLVIASLSVTDPNDFSTPIHVGSWKAPPTLAKSLIELLPVESSDSKGVLLACDKDGNTALHLCAANLQPNVVEGTRDKELFDISVLLALAHREQDSIVMQNAQGDTPLHLLVTTTYSKPLQDRADYDSSLVTAASTLIQFNPGVCLTTDSTGATPLHSAIAANAHPNILNTLLKACTAASTKEDKVGMLPLHYVAAFARTPPSFIDALVSANPSALTHQTFNGDTPLHLAISNANTTVIQNGKINKEALKILGIIIDKHVSPDDSPLFMLNKEKLTPLHCCALFDAPPALTKLLIKHPLGPKAAAMINSFGATALHLAAAQPGVAVSITSITTLGTPEAAGVQDRLRRTPLHVASQNVHATGQLIQALVRLNSNSATIPTQRGHLPLHLSAQSQAKEQVVKELIRAYPNGAQQRNKSGNMPLHDACKYRATATVIKLLLDAYPDAAYAQNNNGYLPLHCAAAYKANPPVVQMLLHKYPGGADMQCKTLDTPLHFVVATSKPSIEIIRMLIQAAPATVFATNSLHENPLEKAKNAGNSEGEHISILENAMNDSR